MKKLLLAAYTGLALIALISMPVFDAMAQVLAPIPVNAAALSTTPLTVKATAGVLQWATCQNPSNAVAFVQVFDTTAAVVLGSTVPVMSLPIAQDGNLPITGPANFLHAIKVAATTTATGNTAPSAALNCVFGMN